MGRREFASPTGTLDRVGYARWGIALLAMKLSLDWLVASVVFERSWSVLHYYVLPLSGIEFWTAIDHPIRAYELTMLLMSLPFLWLGVALTVRRLRHLGWPIAFVLLFVLPMANVLLFSVLLIGSGEGDAARRTTAAGAGPGAIRRCTFTTGDFIEPIEVWDEPNLLRFGVTACPPTMTEMSPWGEITAPHLEGNFVSTRGQFLL